MTLLALRPDAIRLGDADPALFEALSPDAARDARARVVVRARILERGAWDAACPDDGTRVGMLLLDGLLLRTVHACGRRTAELLGPGDVLRPWDHDGDVASVPSGVSWRVLERSRIAVLDRRFVQVSAPWPEIMAAVLGRAVQRAHSLALLRTIADVRRVEDRVRAALWHFADRWGAVGPDGVVVPLASTHEVLAQVVCAQRPTVTAALGRLQDTGEIRRLPDRSWLLIGAPPRGLSPTGGPPGSRFRRPVPLA